MNIRKLKVVEFVERFGYGGTELTAAQFARSLDRSRFEVTFCFLEAEEGSERIAELAAAGINTVQIDRAELPSFLAAASVDIFHIHRAGWADEARHITAAKQAGIPVVVEHNVFGRVDDSPEREMIDTHLFVSHSCHARYAEWLGTAPVGPKHSVIYNPIERLTFDAFGFTDRDYSRPSIGRIGRADNSKWDFTFLEAIPMVREAIHDLEFHVIGMTPEVLQFLHERGCSKNIEVHPMTVDPTAIMSFYKNISILTHFAEMGESFGIVIAEAMAARLPVVTHETPWPKDRAQTELVTTNQNGFVARNAAEYADAVIALLTHPNSSALLGNNGYERVGRCYDLPVVTKGLETIFLDRAAAKGLLD